MAGVKYDGKYLIPAPLVDISQEYYKNGDVIIGNTYKISLRNKFVADKGSPTSSGTWHTGAGYPADETLTHDQHLAAIIGKQQALRQLFAQQGKLLSIEPLDGSTPMTCNPRVVSVEIPEGQWFKTIDYTVNLEADSLSCAVTPTGEAIFDYYLNDAKEDWSIEMAEPQDEFVQATYRVTHNVSAVGRMHYTTSGTLVREAWEEASGWVMTRLGVDWQAVSGTNLPAGLGGFAAFNQVRSQTIDVLGGAFGVTESWVLATSGMTEDFTVETKTGVDDGITRVSINGTINGLDTRDTNFILTQTKWQAASGAWNTIQGNLITRAQNYSNTTLNVIPSITTVTRNPINGTISYNYEYDSRPSTCIANALSEVITISEQYAKDVIAIMPVLGRSTGPVLQSIGTVTETTRSLSIEAIVRPTGGCTYADYIAAKPSITAITGVVAPTATQVYLTDYNDNWSPSSGRFSCQLTWTYQ